MVFEQKAEIIFKEKSKEVSKRRNSCEISDKKLKPFEINLSQMTVLRKQCLYLVMIITQKEGKFDQGRA